MKGNILCLAIGALVCTATPGHACDQWDVSGPVTIEQGNGLRLTGDFHQSGAALSGSLRYYSRALQKGLDVPVNGTVKGILNGDQLRFRVAWEAWWMPPSGPFVGTDPAEWSSTGDYKGTVAGDGRVEGTNFDLKDSANKGSWSLQDAARCSDASTAAAALPPGNPAPPTPHPFVTAGPGYHLGKRTQTDPAPPAPHPFVTAGPGHHLGKWSDADCKPGFYRRAAKPDDMVCVTFGSRALTAYENAHAAERVDPNGAWGPQSCISGYVWREAFDGDLVCTSVSRRAAVKEENDTWQSRLQ